MSCTLLEWEVQLRLGHSEASLGSFIELGDMVYDVFHLPSCHVEKNLCATGENQRESGKAERQKARERYRHGDIDIGVKSGLHLRFCLNQYEATSASFGDTP